MVEERIICCRCGGVVERGDQQGYARLEGQHWVRLATNVCEREPCVREELEIRYGTFWVNTRRIAQRAHPNPSIRAEIAEWQLRRSEEKIPRTIAEEAETLPFETFVGEWEDRPK